MACESGWALARTCFSVLQAQPAGKCKMNQVLAGLTGRHLVAEDMERENVMQVKACLRETSL